MDVADDTLWPVGKVQRWRAQPVQGQITVVVDRTTRGLHEDRLDRGKTERS
jgi:hypothetical protein